MKKRFLEAGKITNTHGLRGEVVIQPWADSADFLKAFPALYIDEKPYRPLSSRVHKNMLIVLFEGICDVTSAMPLKNRVVFIDRNDARLESGAFFIQDILGARVVDEEGGEIGVLREVIESPAANIYAVDAGGREILIPAVENFVLNTDAENGVITVRLIEGM